MIPRLSFGPKHIITALPTVLTHVVTTSKETKDGKAYEGLKRLELKGGEERDRVTPAREKADYLNENERRRRLRRHSQRFADLLKDGR